MTLLDPCLIRSVSPSGDLAVTLRVPLLDDYLEFVAARARPNTVLATGYDLKVFFSVVGKPVRRVRAADVMGFITAQRSGVDGVLPGVVGEGGGLSARTVRRRLSSVSGLYAFLLARGDVTANPVPRGLPTRRERNAPGRGCRCCARHGRCRASWSRPRWMRCSVRCARTGTGRWFRRWCSAGCAG